MASSFSETPSRVHGVCACVDPDGLVLIAELGNSRVSVFTEDGTFVAVVGSAAVFGECGDKGLAVAVNPRGGAMAVCSAAVQQIFVNF